MPPYPISEMFVLYVVIFVLLAIMRSSVHYMYDVFYNVICSEPLVFQREGKEKWLKMGFVYLIIVAIHVVSGGAIGAFLAAENTVLAESITVAGRAIPVTDFYAQLPVYIWCAAVFGILVAALARMSVVCLNLFAVPKALFFEAICTLTAIILFAGPLELSRGEVFSPFENAMRSFPLDRLLVLLLVFVGVLVGTEVGIRHRSSAPAGG